MADLRLVPAAIVVWMALLNTGASYAADKIVLVCSGSMTGLDPHESIHDAEGIVLDLDAGVVVWNDDTFPIAATEGNIIRFKKAELPKPGGEVPPWTEGWLDRVTGTFYATYDFGSASEPKQYTYDLTCKPAKPLF